MTQPSLRSSRWLLALPASLLLHGLLLLACAHLRGPAGGGPSPILPPPPDPGLFETDGNEEPYVYLAPAPQPRRRVSFAGVIAGQESIVVAPASISLPSAVEQAAPAPPNSADSPPAPGGPGTSGLGRGTSFFGIPAQPQKVVYVIDRSASMGLHGAFDAARRELLVSVARLPETACFQVIVYGSRARLLLTDSPRWLAATTANRQLITAALQKLEPEGSTSHDRALPMALALEPDTVFFLTDADDLSEQQVRTVTACNCGRAVIHAVELRKVNRQRPEMPLQVLARENRGSYVAIDLDVYR
jgi:VWA domain-containing protein